MKTPLFLLAALGGLFVPAFGATMISIDFGPPSGEPNSRGNMTGPALVGSAGDQWNHVASGNGTVSNLIDTSGVATTISLFRAGVTDGSQGQFGFDSGTVGAGSEFNSLMEDYSNIRDVNGDGGPASKRFTIFGIGGNGLDDTQVWDIYIYASGDNDFQGSTFTLTQTGGDLTQSTTGLTWSGTFVEGQNYIVFEDVVPTPWASNPSNYEFEFFWTKDVDPGASFGTQFGGLNGIQLVLVPEPGAILLITLTGLAALRRRR